MVHSDLCGPMQTQSLGGALYFMLIIDDCSRFTWVYFLQRKDEAFECFKNWKTYVEKDSGKQVKAIRADKGGEFTSNAFIRFCTENGIRRELANTGSPWENGVVERKNRTVVEMARTMLEHRELPRSLWAEAASTSVHIINRSPTATLHKTTPYEVYFGRKPDVSHFRVFGCDAYVHVAKKQRGKLDSKSQKMIFVGYNTVSKGYRLYDPQRREVVVSLDVVFDEQVASDGVTMPQPSSMTPNLPLLGDDGELFPDLPPEEVPPPAVPEADTEPVADLPSDSVETDVPMVRVPKWLLDTLKDSGVTDYPPDWSEEGLTRRSRRHPSSATAELLQVNYSLMSSIQKDREPTSLREALSLSRWKEAMQVELDSIERNETWTLVPRPPRRNVIGVKWVYKTKYKSDGSLDKHKARLVAKGYAQRPGVDFDETFSPTARMTTIRTVLALAAHSQWPVYQMDVKSAFLNGELQEEVYVEQPPGFKVPGSEGMVYRLRKALYGLKQAPRAWNKKIDSFFYSKGFRRSHADPNLYIYRKDGMVTLVILYVDDLVLTGSNADHIAATKAALTSTFEMTDLGLLHFFLGLEVLQTQRGMFISQRRYVSELLEAFGMEDARPISSPMDPNAKLSAYDSSGPADPNLYRKLVGSLIWLLNTRLDLSFSVGLLSSFMQHPLKCHWQQGLRILRYLRQSPDVGIWYPAGDGSAPVLRGWSDADWGGDPDTRDLPLAMSSLSVMEQSRGVANDVLPTVALSSTEARVPGVFERFRPFACMLGPWALGLGPCYL